MPAEENRNARSRDRTRPRVRATFADRPPHTSAATGWANIRTRDALRATNAYAFRLRSIAALAPCVAVGALAARHGAGPQVTALFELATWPFIRALASMFLGPDVPMKWALLTHVLGISGRRSREMWRATFPHSNKMKLRLIAREEDQGPTVIGNTFADGGRWTVRAVAAVPEGHLIACTTGSWPGRVRRRWRPKIALSLPTPALGS